MKRQRRLIAGKGTPGSKTVGVILDETSEVERLMKEFESHETDEAVFVRRYREMFETMRNPLVKFLVELILADEEKHHTVLQSRLPHLRVRLPGRALKQPLKASTILASRRKRFFT